MGFRLLVISLKAAALALFVINDRLVVLVVADGIGAALLSAAVAAAAELLLHGGLTGGVLLHLARAGAAAHADVLDGSAEAGRFVALEVGQGDEDVSIHNGAADLGGLAVFAVGHGHLKLIGTAQAIANDDLTAGGHGPEAVFLRAAQVLQRVLAAARVQRVAVSQEGLAPLLLAQVCHHLGVVRAQESQVAQLTKVHLDGHELAVHINALDARRNAQAAQFFGQAGAHRTPEVGVIYSRCFHRDFLRF